ncbi:MAG: vWA domain-containing protein [Candidatus Hodarchaeales archaeon]
MASNRKSYYWEVFRNHWRPISVLTVLMVTAPLYIFTTLPPVEIIEEIPQETIKEEEVTVINEIVLNRTISINVTQGGSVFLEQQAPPPLIDSDIVIVLDTSGSMDGSRLATAKEAINNLISVLNQSSTTHLTNDRIGLISFSGNNDLYWDDNAFVETELDFVDNQTHLNDVRNKTNLMQSGSLGKTGSWTDIWTGLSFAVQLLLNNTRNSTALQSVILLTDGDHRRGPWYNETYNEGNYTGFLSLPSNFSSIVYTDNSISNNNYTESPVAVARENGIKIHTIGLFDGGGTDFDANFLLNISKNIDLGTFGEYFIGDDNLTITESFLQARDSASGWIQLLANETFLQGNGTTQLYSYNVTENVRRLKWDLNWENTSIEINATLINPNGTVIDLFDNVPDDIVKLSIQNPYSLIIDFPIEGLWKFNITWFNITNSERFLSRLASYQPPIFIDKVTQLNATDQNETLELNFITFELNVTNKNPLFNLTDITPVLLTNFSEFNYTYSWNPVSVSVIPVNSSTTFILNITLQESVFIQGNMLLMINSTEGYYDAYAQPLSLDYRAQTQNTTIETYLETQTAIITEQSTVIGYTYDRQAFDTLNWIGLIVTFLLFFAIIGLYVKSKEARLRKIASQIRGSFLRDRVKVESALVDVGVDVSQLSMDQLLSSISDLDELGTTIQDQTGTILSTEDLIKVASGVNTENIATRISNITGVSSDNVLQHISEASSIDEISQRLNLSYDDFMFIISRDEQVDTFQSQLKSMMTPIIDPASSRMAIYDEVDINRFRSKLRKASKK